MKNFSFIFGLIVLVFTAGCGKDSVSLAVVNDSDIARKGEMIETPAEEILRKLGSEFCYVTDPAGSEVPSQLTYDGLLIFRANVAANSESVYTVHPADTLHIYPQLTAGRLYPERADDVAWENEEGGYRIYGPTTQGRGERVYGYDIFFKHPTTDLIVERLYAPETDPRTWEKVDSLRAIDPILAEDFIKTFSYHLDHGLGMDCYAVGETLGAGVAAFVGDDGLEFPWCYETAEVLDNGPLRFTVRLDFAPRAVGNETLTEHRLISLDAGSHLNRTAVWFDGMTESRDIAVGFPRRDNGPSVADSDAAIVAYSDPTQGPDNGRALLGAIMECQVDSVYEEMGHILARTPLAPADTLRYYWGQAWDRGNIRSMEAWSEYLADYSRRAKSPLKTVIR